jgi:MoaA/NifB/PqqE/SkfB family radical SAM enzyme
MLKAIHFLLTYICNLECEHCFLYGSPRAKGTFTLEQMRKALDEITKLGTIEWIYFEGGEAFLFYPLMLEGIKLARNKGFKTGVVTNAYWATSEEDAALWLRPLCELGLSDLSISDDSFHYEDDTNSPARKALAAAKQLGIPACSICIEKPTVNEASNQPDGEQIISGGVLFKGRAVEKLLEGLPMKRYDTFTECPEEDLRNPQRVHLDPYGYVHLCQGLVMGNMYETRLSELIKNYNADLHPICGPLLKGGPALLARTYGVRHNDDYVTACHFCYHVRLALLDKFPEYLTPPQVYGLE